MCVFDSSPYFPKKYAIRIFEEILERAAEIVFSRKVEKVIGM
jgi:hypothetical protein